MVVVTCSLSETALLAIPCRSVPFQVSITLAKVLAVYRVPVPRHSWKVIDASLRIYPNDDVIWTLQRCRRRAIFSKIFGDSSVGSKRTPRDHQQPDSQGVRPIGHPLLPFCRPARQVFLLSGRSLNSTGREFPRGLEQSLSFLQADWPGKGQPVVSSASPSATSTLAIEAGVTIWYRLGMKKRSPPARTGKSVHVRVPDRQLALIKKWIEKQPEPRPSIPQAILRLAGIALACDAERSDE
jgi:hypothetical protein